MERIETLTNEVEKIIRKVFEGKEITDIHESEFWADEFRVKTKELPEEYRILMWEDEEKYYIEKRYNGCLVNEYKINK